MVQSLSYLKESASQTAGPFVHIGLAPGDAGFDIYRTELGRDIAGPNAPGTRITVTGTVTDGTGAPVTDVLIEVWQADADGIYPGQGTVADGFRGWGRVIPDFDSGMFTIKTVKPGQVMGRNGRMMAPHLNLWLVARGINTGLNTRMYFADQETANAADPVLNLIEQTHRRQTLIARADGDSYHFDICLQGEDETVFFDI
ncbi:protocatechuate 3,4-dioxygenase subunit alpha [Roseovarius pelagicus]|uniref:Protocatechuate 3,4-dioxygenase subunit alpha n=1 Tax=Roseovarius pelagicus TaxID=2980108 RepID=A0ABY6D8H5_9RHOB|nr:protocatechuate 3,4-dioxygenase subunit alpha [Roseovarius pelagicus]UXX82209.1 protocatechuate 3,4-dioxygenase subunit alpha [Roseovarius pelagicus]